VNVAVNLPPESFAKFNSTLTGLLEYWTFFLSGDINYSDTKLERSSALESSVFSPFMKGALENVSET